MNLKNNENYNIGLDIGVGSVGWCVTDEKGEILKKNGKNMWGSRIFSEANTAKETRNFRGARRRLDRRKQRIHLLQNMLLEDMEKEYPNFFPMIKETSLDFEDKIKAESILGVKYNLFSDSKITDREYYEKFPTIYHLRSYLIKTEEKVDLRLVYLAIHHIMKYRGNFLYEGNFSNNIAEIEEKWDIVLDYLQSNYEIGLKQELNEIIQILSEKNGTKMNKKEKLLDCFQYDKTEKAIVVNVINAILGYTFDLTKIFEIELENSKISFSNEIENEEEIKNILQEKTYIYEAMHEIASWFTLQNILKGKNYISEAMMEKYEKYAQDLKILKDTYKRYFPKEYKSMFRKYDKDNYVAYVGNSCGRNYKKCKPEEFFSRLKAKIKSLPEGCPEKERISKELEDNNFLRKLNVVENSAIPHQLHERELEKILKNQSKYYPTLKENKENILELFHFRIPYYVGPLAKENGKWSWVVRKSNEHIRPWNFEEIVDEDATAEAFIKRMTNSCTYLVNEDVMPKQSLLYSKFCVLNELNNIRVDGKHIAKDTKMQIIEKLFKRYKKVTKKMLINFYKIEGISVKNIEGLQDDENFMSNMSAYIDMERIFGKVDERNFEQCENLIYWITIFEEKKILKRKIRKEYKEITEEQMKQLIKLKYTGWSRLSKKLLDGLKSNDGETIMQKLENTTLNFMQILHNKEYGFDREIEKSMNPKEGKIRYEEVAEIPTSPANKRAIWQTISVVKEIAKIMKNEPQNIYIEFARAEDTDKQLKNNRQKQLLKKYEEIEKQVKELKEYDHNVYLELKKNQNEKNLSEKMYLYYIQNGKCLYSGKALNIDELSRYEVDHILPQSYIKDDSIDNKALVLKEENQRKKDSMLLADEIIDARITWWQSLLENGLISQTKYYRLIRRKMFNTNEDREKFVQRQLVETRQITKYVTNLLKNEYKNTDIYAIRGELTHNFREKYKIYKNRNVNHYHHAQDAYILSIIGNIIRKEWKGTEQFKYSEYVKNYFKDEKNKYEKNGMILAFVNKYLNIEKIKKVMQYKDCYVSRMLEEGTGAFYKQTLYSPKEKPVISLKSNKAVEKYGGYSGEQKAYCAIYGYKNKKNEIEYQLVGIPIQVSYEIKEGKQTIENYIQNTHLKGEEYTDFKILRNKILVNQEYLDENGEAMRLCSDKEIRPSKELVLNRKMSELVHNMNLPENKLDDQQKKQLTESYEDMFQYLLEKLNKEYKIFASIYEKVKEQNDTFERLDDSSKKAVINGLIDLMETGQGNLKFLGLGDRAGRKHGQEFKTDKLLKMIFIDKSVTGMYERRYKIEWDGEQS